MDLVAAVRQHLAEGLFELGDRIYAERVPPGTPLAPFLVVRPFTDVQAFDGVTTWTSPVVLVDFVGDSDSLDELHGVLAAIVKRLSDLRGRTIGGFTFQHVDRISSAFAFDTSVTPALPRWVLTVPMTVRSTVTTHEGVVA